MKVVMVFHVDDEVVDGLMKADMHAEDVMEEINTEAQLSSPWLVWHFSDKYLNRLRETLKREWFMDVDPLSPGKQWP